ncbi:hypothetical protein IFR05_005184 [Cadophora sp. M221]|nr:hypothetical protein IFR05_005184 [Cadophora sp. M221]
MASIKLFYLIISMSIVTFIGANPVPDLTNITTAIGDDESFLLSEDEIRASILSTWPADKITTSAELHNFIKQAPPSIGSESGQDIMIYLSDTNTFATFSPLNTSLVSRQVPQCFAYDQWGSRGAHAWWGPWHAMTPCQSSHVGGAGGYLTYTEGDSVGHSYGGG